MSTGVTKTAEFKVAGATSWSVPSGVSGVLIDATAAGGAGFGYSSGATAGREGGGAGEYCRGVWLAVTPGGTLSITIGAKGTGANGNGSSGGNTTVGPLTLIGGEGSQQTSGRTGKGGTAVFPQNSVTSGPGLPGSYEGAGFTQGASGGFRGVLHVAGSPGGAAAGQAGGDGGTASGTTGGGGGGGGSSPWGPGGAGANGAAGANTAGGNAPATSYGAGGGGAGGTAGAGNTAPGGNGCDGYVLLSWVE